MTPTTDWENSGIRESTEAPRDKAEFLRLWTADKLGNRLRSWDSLRDLQESGYRGTVGIRSRQKGGTCRYYVPVDQVPRVLGEMGASEATHYFGESAPEDRLTLQGELRRSPAHWYLNYSTAKLPMRKALAEQGRHAEGLEALGLLKLHCDAAGYDMLMDLFDRFDQGLGECVVEFSCYEMPLGWQQTNVIAWETRSC